MSGRDFFARLLISAVREIAEEIGRPQRERREDFAAAARKREEELRQRREERVKSPEYKRRQEQDATRRETQRAWRAEAEERKSSKRMAEEVLREALVDDCYSFDRLKAHYLVPAIALVRPYPPHREPSGRSHVGGCPDLPAGTAWPRTPTGEALHFLGQIDLAEAPACAAREALPAAGTMLFFVRIDQPLHIDEPGAIRVLFDPASSGCRTEPPDDLPAVDGKWMRNFAATGELGPHTLPSWPWQLVAIDTMPDAKAFQLLDIRGRVLDGYREAHRKFRAEEIRKATGQSRPAEGEREDLGLFRPKARGEPHALLPFAETGFPWVARGVELAVRSVLRHCRQEPFAAFEGELRSLWTRAEAHGPAEPVDATEGEALADILNRMLAVDVRIATRPDGQEVAIHETRINNAIATAAYRLITEAGGDPVLAARLPNSLYASARSRHFTSCPSQMLGYLPSSQDPLQLGASTLTLLQLQSDWGIDLVIGDMGEFDFRLEPDALARHDWDSVVVSYAGG